MNQENPINQWFIKSAEKEVKKDIIPNTERYGQIIGIVIVIIAILFFALHQTRDTGFFTEDFGTFEAFMFYAAAAYSIIPAMAKILTGRKNIGRGFDIIGGLIFLIVAVYLLLIFPFDFSHVAEPLPHSLEFLISWISDTFAKIVISIGIVIMLAVTPYNSILFWHVRSKLSEPEIMETIEEAKEENGIDE